MVFSSVLFLFRFLPIFMICYFLVPRNMKNLVLFLGSLVFYAWGEPVYIFLMLFSTISDFVWGRLIEEYRGRIAPGSFCYVLLLSTCLSWDFLNMPIFCCRR